MHCGQVESSLSRENPWMFSWSSFFFRKLAGNLWNDRYPIRAGTLDGFGDRVVDLGQPIGTIENKCDGDFLSGGLHTPCVSPSTLGIA